MNKRILKTNLLKTNEMFESWNNILDKQIKPLRSKNARTIFQIFLDINHMTALTTLDIEKKLDKAGIDLDKKEINGWLGSLLEAGLISKEKSRGKPTTFNYHGKYTFDLWKITPTGQKIAYGLTHFSKPEEILTELDLKSFLMSIQNMSNNEITKVFQQIAKLDILLRVLNLISEGPSQISTSNIAEGLKISSEKIDGVLSSYLENSDLPIFVKKTLPLGIRERFRNIIGLSRGTTYSLTEDGKRLSFLLKRSET